MEKGIRGVVQDDFDSTVLWRNEQVSSFDGGWWEMGEDDPRQLDSNFKCFSIGIRRYFLTRFSFTCPVEDCAVQDP